MRKSIVIALACWALGMLGVLITNMGYVAVGKTLSYVFGTIGIILIFVGLVDLIRDRIIQLKKRNP